ncbi:hypothetical protein ACRAWF_33245 [Streptomyces sp. L7]
MTIGKFRHYALGAAEVVRRPAPARRRCARSRRAVGDASQLRHSRVFAHGRQPGRGRRLRWAPRSRSLGDNGVAQTSGRNCGRSGAADDARPSARCRSARPCAARGRLAEVEADEQPCCASATRACRDRLGGPRLRPDERPAAHHLELAGQALMRARALPAANMLQRRPAAELPRYPARSQGRPPLPTTAPVLSAACPWPTAVVERRPGRRRPRGPGLARPRCASRRTPACSRRLLDLEGELRRPHVSTSTWRRTPPGTAGPIVTARPRCPGPPLGVAGGLPDVLADLCRRLAASSPTPCS